MIIISYIPYQYQGNHGNDNEYSQKELNLKSLKVPTGIQQSLNETGTIYVSLVIIGIIFPAAVEL
jgi:hypothetical protein